MSNRRFISVSVRSGIQNLTGERKYDHQGGDIFQTWPDTPAGFEGQTDIQEKLFIGIAELMNELLVDQKNEVLELVKKGEFEVKGEDL